MTGHTGTDGYSGPSQDTVGVHVLTTVLKIKQRSAGDSLQTRTERCKAERTGHRQACLVTV